MTVVWIVKLYLFLKYTYSHKKEVMKIIISKGFKLYLSTISKTAKAAPHENIRHHSTLLQWQVNIKHTILHHITLDLRTLKWKFGWYRTRNILSILDIWNPLWTEFSYTGYYVISIILRLMWKKILRKLTWGVMPPPWKIDILVVTY